MKLQTKHYGNTDEGASTGKVREKKPNPWGLYDMHGNASEWVLDQFEPHYYQRNGVSTNPLNVSQTLYPRVVRGGSYMDAPDRLRSAARQKSSSEWMNREPRVPQGIWWHRGEDWWFGFRVVRPLREPTEEEKLTKWDAQEPSVQREKYLKAYLQTLGAVRMKFPKISGCGYRVVQSVTLGWAPTISGGRGELESATRLAPPCGVSDIIYTLFFAKRERQAVT